MLIETTHCVSDSTVSACIPGMKVQLHVVHPAAVLLTKVQPWHSNYPIWWWVYKNK